MKKQFASVLLLSFLFSNLSSASLKVALNWKPEPQFGGFYEAERAGFFKKENLEIQILEGGSGTPTVQMLANDKVDFAVVSAEEILIYNDKNPKNKVVAIFASFQTNPQIIMTHNERGFTSLKQVFESPGVVALQSGLSYVAFLEKKWGRPKAQLVPYLGGITNFLNNPNYSQQGFLTSEPVAAELRGLKVKTFLVADEGYNPYATVVAVKKDFLTKNEKQTQGFIKALRQGWADYLIHPEATNQLMAQKNKGMDPETFKKSSAAQVKLIQPDPNFKLGTMTAARWTQLREQMFDLKLIPSKSAKEIDFINL